MITTNSLGKRIAKTDEQIAAFWRWFGDSAAREPMVSSKEKWSDKRPLVLYHGTKHGFASFRPVGTGTVSHTFGSYTTERHGIFLAESAAFASTFAEQGEDPQGGRVIPVYLRVENPLYLENGLSEEDEASLASAGVNIRWLNNLREPWEAFDGDDGAVFIAALKKAGFDGVNMTEEDPTTGEREEVWVAFRPTQIKSAIGNRGTFDPSDPVITNPRVTLRPAPRLSKAARRQLRRGIAVEMEHTRSRKAARTIAAHHLAESPRYYRALAQLEKRLRRNPLLGNTGLEFKQNAARKLLRLALRHEGADADVVDRLIATGFDFAKANWEKANRRILHRSQWPQLRLTATLELARMVAAGELRGSV